MKVSILRYNPEKDSGPYYENYDIPYMADGKHTVMEVLQYIYNNLDLTLRFYSHSACAQGICGRCAIKVNKKPVLACTHFISKENICIEPVSEKVYIDLVAHV